MGGEKPLHFTEKCETVFLAAEVMIAIRQFGWLDVTALGVAAVAPTLAYDCIGAAAAIIRWLRENPGKLADMWPWGRKP